jgi:hypothetical protein
MKIRLKIFTKWVTNRKRNTSSVGDMLQHLKWRSFEDRRRDARLVMTRWQSVKMTDKNIILI